jgi:hypothetical protein
LEEHEEFYILFLGFSRKIVRIAELYSVLERK